MNRTFHPVARCLRALTLLAITAGASAAGHAEMLLAQTALLSGNQTFTSTFSVSGAGTVTVHLADLDWPQRLASLSFAAVNSTTVLASLAGPGTVSFDVFGPGSFTAIVAGAVSSAGALHLGAYSLQVDCVPQVPLPASGLLLLSAVAGLLGITHGRGQWAALRLGLSRHLRGPVSSL